MFVIKVFLNLIFVLTLIEFICEAIKPEDYLSKYGYMDKTTSRTGSVIKDAIKTFQSFNRLPTTGVLDEKTIKLMSIPRCGNKDPVEALKTRAKTPVVESGDYNLQGSKWINYKLTYRVFKWSEQLNKSQTLEIIEMAFKKWSAVTPLRFIYQTDNKIDTHLDLSFEKRVHCCHTAPPYDSQFDGPGGTLAHASYPEDYGRIHIDDDEKWTYTSFDVKDHHSLLYTLVHEMGHSLGLEHSYDCRSVMYFSDDNPCFTRTDQIALDSGSIKGIRILYGNESIKLP